MTRPIPLPLNSFALWRFICSRLRLHRCYHYFQPLHQYAQWPYVSTRRNGGYHHHSPRETQMLSQVRSSRWCHVYFLDRIGKVPAYACSSKSLRAYARDLDAPCAWNFSPLLSQALGGRLRGNQHFQSCSCRLVPLLWWLQTRLTIIMSHQHPVFKRLHGMEASYYYTLRWQISRNKNQKRR